MGEQQGPRRRIGVLIAAICAAGALAAPALASAPSARPAAGSAPGLMVAGQPAGIAADADTQTMWVAEHDADQPSDVVSEVTETGDTITPFSVPSAVSAIVADPITGLVWTISNSSDGSVHTVSYVNEYNNAVTTITIPSATSLTALTIDETERVVFVLDQAGDVYTIDEAHPTNPPSLLITGSLTAATGIAVDNSTGTIWVLDSTNNQVVSFSERTGDPSGNPAAAVGDDPGQIAIDSARGVVWVGAADGMVSEFKESIPTSVRTLTLGSAPASIELDVTNNRVWVGTKSGAIYDIDGAASPPLVAAKLTVSGEVNGLALDVSNGQLWATENVTGTDNVVSFVPSAPQITSLDSTWFAVNNPAQRSFQVLATGFPPASYSLSGAPSWLSINADRGVLTAKLTAHSKPGSAAIKVVASNGTGSPAEQSFTAHAGSDPVLKTGSATFAYGVRNSVQLQATGTPAPVTFRGSGLPAGFTLSKSGLLAGTPSKGTKSPARFTVLMSNAVTQAYDQPVSSIFTLKFAPGRAPRITSPDTATFKHGKKGSFTVKTTGFPVPAVSVAGKLPKGLTIKISAGSAVISGTPAASGKGKTYKIKIMASNGVGKKATQTLALKVT